MRAPKSYIRPMFAVAVVFALFACVDRSDPTAPGTPNTSDDVTVAVRLPVASLEVGHTVTAVAVAKTSSGQTVSVDSIEWSTSDTSILAVSPAGEIRARKMGSAAVFAKWRKRSGKGSLSVTDTLPAKIVVSPSRASESVGGQMHLSAAVATATGRALPSHAVKWKSTDTRYVTVSASGLITAARVGSAQVIATASDVSDTAVVSVSPATIANLSVTPGTSTLSSGETVQLNAQASDADGNGLTGRAVGWASSDESIASVSTSGVVTGGKIGTATITATAEGTRASATIHVTAGDATSITLTPGSVGLVAGATQQLTASLEDEAGNGLAANDIAWASANAAVAKVTPSGLVTAVHPGSTTITAVSGSAMGRASVVVSAGAVKTVTVTPASFSLASGGTRQLAVKLVDAVGNVVDADAAWSSSNNTVATVSATGLVTAKQAGSATISAAAGGAKGSAALTVEAGSVSSITVTPGSASLSAGDTQQLAAKLTDNSGSVITGQTITWSSSDASIVKVSSTGLATAAKAGKATITATAGGKTGSSVFSVTAGAVNTVAISPASGTVVQGKTMQLAASFTDAAGNTVSAHSVAWTSSTATVATVSNSGLVTGQSAGHTTITATADGKSKTAVITVTSADTHAPPTLTKITISPASTSLAPNGAKQFTAGGVWSDGSTTPPTAAYSATGGSITPTGMYTAGSTAGTFRVIATVTGQTMSDTAIITIANQVSASASCSDVAHSRLVSVSTAAELHSALQNAKPGDLIDLADGSYHDGNEFRITSVSGTSSQRITLCGSANAVIDGGGYVTNDGIHAVGANYWSFRGFSITNSLRDFYAEGSSRDSLVGLNVHNSGQEAIHIHALSKGTVLTKNHIYDTGKSQAIWGAGIYIGTTYTSWGQYSGGQPDASDSTVIDGNRIGPTTAEAVILHDGTSGAEVMNNTFDGSAVVISSQGYPKNWVTVQGNYNYIHNNTGTDIVASGFGYWALAHAPGWGSHNTFAANTSDLGGGDWAFEIDGATTGNVVKCSNTVSDARRGLSSIPCSP